MNTATGRCAGSAPTKAPGDRSSPGCFATKRALDKLGVEYDEINLEQHPELLAQFKRQGMMQAPIAETKDGERWAGCNPAKLKEHGLDYRSRQQRGGDSGRDTRHGR